MTRDDWSLIVFYGLCSALLILVARLIRYDGDE